VSHSLGTTLAGAKLLTTHRGDLAGLKRSVPLAVNRTSQRAL